MRNYEFYPEKIKELMYKMSRQPRKYNVGFITAENSQNKRVQKIKAVSQNQYDEKGD